MSNVQSNLSASLQAKAVPSRRAATKATSSPLADRARTRSVTLIYCPLHLGGPHAGAASMGPAAMKVAQLKSKIERLGFKIVREVDIDVPDALCWWEKSTNQARCVPEIGQVSLDVAKAVEEALEAGTIPLTLGGDHSLAIGSIAGVSAILPQTSGRVWRHVV